MIMVEHHVVGMSNTVIITIIITITTTMALVLMLAVQHLRRPRTRLPRVFEMKNLVAGSASPKAFFQNFEPSLKEIPLKFARFRELEGLLQGLDAAAWDFLKSEIRPLLLARDEKRGWQQLFDKLNQARAYNYLQRVGYRDIRFIPESKVKSQKAPDLEATRDATRILCEVKTINVSEDEAEHRFAGGVGSTSRTLGILFLQKLRKTIEYAQTQMVAHDAQASQLVYVIVNFDDIFHEYAEDYSEEINQFMANNPISGVEVVFEIKPAFG